MQKKIVIVFSLAAVILIFTSFRVLPPSHLQNTLRTIIIDAGHGGKDFGAKGVYSYEKNITLAIALKLQATLQQSMPDVKIVVTRSSDIYQHPTLKANIANQSKGDLFLCIHCNAAPAIKHSEITGYKNQTYYTGKGSKRRKHTRKVPVYHYWSTPNPAKGTETYIWAAHKNDDKELAMRENESLYTDSVLAQQVADFDPDSPEKRILYSLKTQQYFTRSANLALDVEQEFTKVGRISREARQRQVGIWVLQATAMPSILVETGYITNPEEEDYLNSPTGQQEICDVITRAVEHYKTALETNSFRLASDNSQ